MHGIDDQKYNELESPSRFAWTVSSATLLLSRVRNHVEHLAGEVDDRFERLGETDTPEVHLVEVYFDLGSLVQLDPERVPCNVLEPVDDFLGVLRLQQVVRSSARAPAESRSGTSALRAGGTSPSETRTSS